MDQPVTIVQFLFVLTLCSAPLLVSVDHASVPPRMMIAAGMLRTAPAVTFADSATTDNRDRFASAHPAPSPFGVRQH